MPAKDLSIEEILPLLGAETIAPQNYTTNIHCGRRLIWVEDGKAYQPALVRWRKLHVFYLTVLTHHDMRLELSHRDVLLVFRFTEFN